MKMQNQVTILLNLTMVSFVNYQQQKEQAFNNIASLQGMHGLDTTWDLN